MTTEEEIEIVITVMRMEDEVLSMKCILKRTGKIL